MDGSSLITTSVIYWHIVFSGCRLSCTPAGDGTTSSRRPESHGSYSSRIEPHVLETLPGADFRYSGWQEQVEVLEQILRGSRSVAMQYSPKCAVPYVSMVDAGTIELVRSCGVDVSTSADLVAEFEAVWSQEQFRMHIDAVERVQSVRREAFDLIGQRLRSNECISECEVQQFILLTFRTVATCSPIMARSSP